MNEQDIDLSLELVVYINTRGRIQRLRAATKDKIGPSWLAEKSGLAKSFWHKIDKQPVPMTLATLRKMALALQCTEADLVARRGVIRGIADGY